MIRRYESGATPGAEKVAPLATALDLDPDEVLRAVEGAESAGAPDDGPLLGKSITSELGNGTSGGDRYGHLVAVGQAWDYELVDPETGEVRMALNVRLMAAPAPRQRAMSVKAAAESAGPPPADSPPDA